jgi:ribosomal protein L7/L12
VSESSTLWLIGAAAVTALVMVVVGILRVRGGTPPGLRGMSHPMTPADQAGLSKIERIKRYREQHGVGLKEAKDAVEAELAGRTPATPAVVAVSRGSSDNVEELVRAGNHLAAIKLYREQHGVGLKEAKDAIDALRARGER